MQEDLKKLAIKLGTDGPVKTLPTQRKIQILYCGQWVARSTKGMYVWEHPYYPQLYIPKADVTATCKQSGLDFEAGEEYKDSAGKAVATRYTIKFLHQSTDKALVFSDNLSGKAEVLKNMVKIDFASMDQWFEEDTPIYVHPKDPFKRVDILQSNRDIKVKVDGQMIAHTSTAMHLYETGLPCRFYIPLTSIDLSVLRASSTQTKCPYKGTADYYSVEVNGKVHEDLFWYYINPTLESSKIQGLCCPYNERVDIELDGEKLDRPVTHFGKAKDNKKPSAVD